RRQRDWFLAGGWAVQSQADVPKIFFDDASGTVLRVHNVRLSCRMQDVAVGCGVERHDISAATVGCLAWRYADLAVIRSVGSDELENHGITADLAIHGHGTKREARVVA